MQGGNIKTALSTKLGAAPGSSLGLRKGKREDKKGADNKCAQILAWVARKGCQRTLYGLKSLLACPTTSLKQKNSEKKAIRKSLVRGESGWGAKEATHWLKSGEKWND